MISIRLKDGRVVTVIKQFYEADPQYYPQGLFMVTEPQTVQRGVFFVDGEGYVLARKSDPQPDGTYYLTR